MNHPGTVRDLYNSLRERLGLRWIAGKSGANRELLPQAREDTPRILAGPLNYIHPNRVQIIGPAEIRYLDELDPQGRAEALSRLATDEPAAVVVTDLAEPSQDLIDVADQHGMPLFTATVSDSQALDNLQYYASVSLSEIQRLHGVFLEVLGMGVLLTGDAAVGKSELALDLITRGARLIADDVPEFQRVAPDLLSGTCPPLLREFLEVRGLGILNIRAMFGDSAIKRTKYLRLIVHLQRMNDGQIAKMDRLTGSHSSRKVMGVSIPQVTVPVAPGRNLSIMVENAVRNHLLRLKGYDATEDFSTRQQRAIEGNRLARK